MLEDALETEKSGNTKEAIDMYLSAAELCLKSVYPNQHFSVFINRLIPFVDYYNRDKQQPILSQKAN
jgi:hypothetical protein